MKHLKTFESFSVNSTEMVEEGIFGNFFKPPLNKTKQRIITQGLDKLDTDTVKFMCETGKEDKKKPYSKEGFIKMATDVDNFNGSSKIDGDTICYSAGNFKSASGGLKGTGGAGG